MAQPKYFDKDGQEVVFYHPVDAFEALELGVVTVGESKPAAPAPKEEEPKVEEVVEAPAPEAEEAEEAPKKRAPRRRSAE